MPCQLFRQILFCFPLLFLLPGDGSSKMKKNKFSKFSNEGTTNFCNKSLQQIFASSRWLKQSREPSRTQLVASTRHNKSFATNQITQNCWVNSLFSKSLFKTCLKFWLFLNSNVTKIYLSQKMLKYRIRVYKIQHSCNLSTDCSHWRTQVWIPLEVDLQINALWLKSTQLHTWLLPYHGELWWSNLDTATYQCPP